MEFVTTVAIEANGAELEVWQRLKEALANEPGYACLRYPIFASHRGRRHEPDIVLLHPRWGFVVIEVKGCRADQVKALTGHEWHMENWHCEVEAPYDQAQKQMWAMRRHFDRYALLRDRLPTTALVALPFVSESEWAERGFAQLPCNPGILHQNQLTPARLRRRLEELVAPSSEGIGEAAFTTASQVLGLRSVLELNKSDRSEPLNAPPESLLAAIRLSETRIASLDSEQQRIGFEIPPGPQRIRGIAGSGKTLLLALKAARMHLSHPTWDIAFTFNTKSLYQVVCAQLELFCRELGDTEPNWEKLRVLHGWGGRSEAGLYQTLAVAARHPARSVDWVKAQAGFVSPSEGLALVAQDLLDHATVPECFDAILIDEGQDFLPEFYRLAYAALRNPKRLVWAYDEAQSLEHLKIPNAETLFGRDAEGRLKVDLTGQYPGGILKSRIMRKCYRTPARILMPAHAFGMGLLREEGPVQFITSKAGWADIGYEVIEGGFESSGREVVVKRPAAHCPHPLDTAIEEPLIRPRPFASRAEELEDTADRLKDLTARGVDPSEVLVVFLGASRESRPIEADMHALAALLAARGLTAHLATKANARVFRQPGAITLSGIHRAKGNEAPYVFVVGLDRLASVEADSASRNQLFVGLTRARGLCRLSGVVPEASALFEELERVMAQGNTIRFRTPDAKKEVRELSETPEPVEIRPFERHLPLYADLRAIAGTFDHSREHDPDALEWVDAGELGALNADMFVMRIQGRSMEPRIQDGDFAVFQRIKGAPPEGKIVLASLRADGTEAEVSLVVKRLDLETDAAGLRYRLSSLNPEFPPIPVHHLEEGGVRIEAVFKRVLGPQELV